jgi:hypothetical protein
MNSNKQMRAQFLDLGHRLPRLAALAVLGALALAGCSGGSSVDQNPVPDRPSTGVTPYGGAPAVNDDIAAFQNEFWDKVRANDSCGGCHNATGQAPSFARSDDVNQAYQQAVTVVDRTNPSLSRVVTKVLGGHNCNSGDPQVCADVLTRYITAWVGAESGGGRQIQLIEPSPINPGSSKRLPADPPAAFRQVYNILDTNCSGCHQPDSATAQSPFFAVGSQADALLETKPEYREAYLAAVPKMNVSHPGESRFVVRLKNEGHNCWTNSCTNDAAVLQAAIQALADSLPAPQTPPGLLSKALTLYDGTLASGGNRYEKNLVALYEFKTGHDGIAYDSSGVSPAADLLFPDPEDIREDGGTPGIEWVGGYGLNIRSGSAKALTATSRKFYQQITASGEYSLEAWVAPANVTQENAPIVSYAGSVDTRNFTMGQNIYSYEFSARNSATNANGGPKLSTDDDAELLQATLQHVVMTFDPVNGRRIYVNGQFTGDVDGAGGGTLQSWNDSFAFLLGNETDNGATTQFQGVVRLVGVYNRALTLQQIQQNFEAGVGEKFFLLFGISHLIDVPRSYILFEAEQYDTYSYLFKSPKFISLDPAAMPGTIPLKGMRIGVNGTEAQVGQAYRLLDMNISNEMYSAATGQLLSSVGTIIPVVQSAMTDQFFLCFDLLGARTDACTAYTAGVPSAPVVGAPTPDIGVKLFDAINATMASITGVSPNATAIKSTYENVRQSLPAVHDIKGYLSSHQTSVAQLALQYCNVMVDDNALRTQFFPGTVNFTTALTAPDYSAVNTNGQAVIDTLRTKMVGTANTQPTSVEFDGDMGELIRTLCNPGAGGAACTAGRTTDVIKAACGAALGSAATLVQ